MKRPLSRIRWEYLGAALIVGCMALVLFIKVDRHYLFFERDQVKPQFWGITYSKEYAQSLGLDWQAAYLAMITDLGATKIRLPVYWDDVAPDEQTLHFSDYDWMIEEGAKHHVEFILALGGRLPRWPECHLPAWVANENEQQRQEAQLAFLRSAIAHFQPYKNIVTWQLQNEYYVTWFGDCSVGDSQALDQQLQLIHSLDQRPILLTDSGEFSLWRQVSKQADIVGTTMYRVAWNPYLGYTYTPWPAWFYQAKALLNGLSREKVIVAELQAEPWPPGIEDIRQLSASQIDASFSLQQFATNLELARRTDFAVTYLWGAEWWYWLAQHGDSRYWSFAQTLFKS